MSPGGFLRSATRTSARIFVLALLSAVVAKHVCAFQCGDAIGAARFSPAHPSTSDVISVQVLSYNSRISAIGPTPPGTMTLSRVTLQPNNTIAIDVINTPNPSDFQAIPALVSFNLVASPADDSYGIIGPLPAGDYVVPTSVLNDYSGTLYPFTLCVNPVMNHLTVASQSAATAVAPVVEFYYSALITSSPRTHRK